MITPPLSYFCFPLFYFLMSQLGEDRLSQTTVYCKKISLVLLLRACCCQFVKKKTKKAPFICTIPAVVMDIYVVFSYDLD